MLCSTEYSSWSSCYIFICYHFQPGFLAKENKSDSLETKFKREPHICGCIKTNCWAGKMTQRVSVAAAKPDDLRPVSRREERIDSCKLSNLGCCLFSICILMPIDFQHISGKHTLYFLSDSGFFWTHSVALRHLGDFSETLCSWPRAAQCSVAHMLPTQYCAKNVGLVSGRPHKLCPFSAASQIRILSWRHDRYYSNILFRFTNFIPSTKKESELWR